MYDYAPGQCPEIKRFIQLSTQGEKARPEVHMRNMNANVPKKDVEAEYGPIAQLARAHD